MVRTLRRHTLASSGIGVTLLALWSFGGHAAQTTRPQILVAAVIDTKGESTTVSGLRARYYWDSRDTPGPIAGTVLRTPGSEQTAVEIRIDLEFQEGRTTWHEQVRVPMNNLRLLSMESRSIAPFPPEKLVVQQRDGSTIQLSKVDGNFLHFDTFDERDSQGTVKRSFKPGSRPIRGKATLGQDGSRLAGFEGSAKVSTGASGTFSIELNEVRRIEFK